MAQKKEYKNKIKITNTKQRKNDRNIVETWFESGLESDFNLAYPILKKYVLSFLGLKMKKTLKLSQEDLEDIFSNVMVKTIDQYRNKDLKKRLKKDKPVLFETWLITVSRNEAIHFAQKKNVYKKNESSEIADEKFLDFLTLENDLNNSDKELENLFDINTELSQKTETELLNFIENNISEHKFLNRGVLYLYLKYFKDFKPKQRAEFFKKVYNLEKKDIAKVVSDSNEYLNRLKNEILNDYGDSVYEFI